MMPFLTIFSCLSQLFFIFFPLFYLVWTGFATERIMVRNVTPNIMIGRFCIIHIVIGNAETVELNVGFSINDPNAFEIYGLIQITTIINNILSIRKNGCDSNRNELNKIYKTEPKKNIAIIQSNALNPP